MVRILNIRKRIALVAHDNKKADLIEWAEHNKIVLARHENCWRNNWTGP
jgi:methylglyoxal synthase